MTQNTKQCVIGCGQLVSKIQAEIKGINKQSSSLSAPQFSSSFEWGIFHSVTSNSYFTAKYKCYIEIYCTAKNNFINKSVLFIYKCYL